MNFTFSKIPSFARSPLNVPKPASSFPKVAVIVAVRNEAKYITRLLTDLQAQDYPNFEVIIVDDFSSDNTVDLVNSFPATYQLRCIPSDVPPDEVAFKKRSVTIGIAASSPDTEIIITTDGDCSVGPLWISALAGELNAKNLQMLPGPVSYFYGDSLLTRFQYIDFAGWVAVGGASLQLGLANLCSGANLCYRKDAFYAVGGFAGKVVLASGDDEFLLHKMYLSYGNTGVKFCKSKEALVLTEAQPKFSKFVNQRRRWTSKWKRYVNPVNIGLALFYILFYNLLAFALPLLLIFSPAYGFAVLFCWFTFKFIPEALLIRQFLKSQKRRMDWLGFFIYELFVQYYLIYVGFLNLRRGYVWKGRRVH